MQPPVDPGRGPIARIAVPLAARSVQGHRAGIVTRVLAGASTRRRRRRGRPGVWRGGRRVLRAGPARVQLPRPGVRAALRGLPRVPRPLPRRWRGRPPGAATGPPARAAGRRLARRASGRWVAWPAPCCASSCPSCSSGWSSAARTGPGPTSCCALRRLRLGVGVGAGRLPAATTATGGRRSPASEPRSGEPLAGESRPASPRPASPRLGPGWRAPSSRGTAPGP